MPSDTEEGDRERTDCTPAQLRADTPALSVSLHATMLASDMLAAVLLLLLLVQPPAVNMTRNEGQERGSGDSGATHSVVGRPAPALLHKTAAYNDSSTCASAPATMTFWKAASVLQCRRQCGGGRGCM